MSRKSVSIVEREKVTKLDWRDAQLETPPEESLFLLVENTLGETKQGKVIVAEVVAGFFLEGEYSVGTSAVGHPLSADRVVRYWALLDWPRGYDNNGMWSYLELSPKALSETCCGVAL